MRVDGEKSEGDTTPPSLWRGRIQKERRGGGGGDSSIPPPSNVPSIQIEYSIDTLSVIIIVFPSCEAIHSSVSYLIPSVIPIPSFPSEDLPSIYNHRSFVHFSRPFLLNFFKYSKMLHDSIFDANLFISHSLIITLFSILSFSVIPRDEIKPTNRHNLNINVIQTMFYLSIVPFPPLDPPLLYSSPLRSVALLPYAIIVSCCSLLLSIDT